MKNSDLITIIVPVYNVEKYFDRCVKSILGQTYTNLQIILIDDGSTDKSVGLCDKYAAVDKRIEVFHQKHQGASAARNVGLKNCQGDYIGFVDSDDWIEPTMFESMLKALKENDVDAVRCNYNWCYTQKRKCHITSAEKIILSGRDAVIDSFTHSNSSGYGTVIWNTLFKSNILNNPEQLLFDTHLRYGEDTVLLRQLLIRCDEVVLMPESLYNYNWGNPTRTSQRLNLNDKLLYTDVMVDFLKKNSFPERFILKTKNGKKIYILQNEIKSYIAGNKQDTRLIDEMPLFSCFLQEKVKSLGIIKFYFLLFMIKLRMPPMLVRKVCCIRRY